MHKALAEILAGVIPQKMARNRWRGILRYGVFRTLRLKWQLARNKTKPATYLAVCAIAKDEGPYFKEWLDWHISQGVSKFYIYDNGSTDETRQVLEPYIAAGIVEYTYYPGYRKQIAAYDDCMRRHRFDARWIAFIDLDEFIVPIRDKSVIEFLQSMEDYAAVEINWLIYGSGNQKFKSPEPVMKRFRFHSNPDDYMNRRVKSIVDPRRVVTMTGCHESARLSGITADSHGQPVTRNFYDRMPQQDVIRINHYALRSEEEFFEKQRRGRASGKNREVPLSYFRQYDLNDLEDPQ